MRTTIESLLLLSSLMLLFPAASNAGPINLALGQPVTASSEYLPAANIVDGNIDSVWVGSGSSEWAQVDLGALFSLDRIVLWGFNTSAHENLYVVSAGPDPGSLTVVGSVWSPGPAWTSGGPNEFNYWVEFLTPGLSARYIRVDGGGGRDWAAFSELEAYGDPPDGAIPEPSCLILLGSGLGILAAARFRKLRLLPRG